ncbi:hypothetical protein V1281_004305 [Nitrobacteraceae bacterium AZCC 2161]
MTSQQRAILYANAKTHYDQGGKAIVDLIDSAGLALSDGDLLSTDPDYIRMEEIIWSDTGRKAAIAALPGAGWCRSAVGSRWATGTIRTTQARFRLNT